MESINNVDMNKVSQDMAYELAAEILKGKMMQQTIINLNEENERLKKDNKELLERMNEDGRDTREEKDSE
ncbi:hypothetical protein L2Z53_03865 [Macrococcoides canis]|uniref:hypothetical protein n=1 Tax=Macrococcoides canis TaxID=1855823 RepID=UPI001F3650E0|nr:hypothetical protein [Macrococcus canis]UJS28494.1 hypothetical protein L2Z53_03865 [Macrococcus canis]